MKNFYFNDFKFCCIEFMIFTGLTISLILYAFNNLSLIPLILVLVLLGFLYSSVFSIVKDVCIDIWRICLKKHF